MSDIADRHSGDVEGRLTELASTTPIRVTLSIKPDSAHLLAVQHTAWMTLNLLARLQRVVDEIELVCPSGVPLGPHVIPFSGDATLDLATQLRQGAGEVGAVPVVASPGISAIHLSVGPFGQAADGLYHVAGNGWLGGVSRSPIQLACPSRLPFGPYIAACLAVGEVFKHVRAKVDLFERPECVFLSSWTYRVSQELEVDEGPGQLPPVSLDHTLAGVGAVGSAWIHALWACPDLTGTVALYDPDPDGIDLTNLNRYVLFGQASIGQRKVTEAKRVAASCGITWVDCDTGIEQSTRRTDTLVSAVDNNETRAAIQNLYPARILSASTEGLRAEVLRCGPPGQGACLSCYNPPDAVESDVALRERIGRWSVEERTRRAGQVGLSETDLDHVTDPVRCGELGPDKMALLRRTADEREARFAVGFVSVLAGTLLAGETLKDRLASCDVPLNDARSRAVFQFLRPLAQTNGPTFYHRDPACPRCDPSTTAGHIWQQRFSDLFPTRTGEVSPELAGGPDRPLD